MASASAPPSALKNLSTWLARGLNGSKEYLRHQAPKRLDPSLIFPSVKSVLCFGLLYNTDKLYSIECKGQPWIARYARGADYHEVVGAKLKQVEKGINAEFPDARTQAFCDSGPVSEKVWAAAAGLGWQGKNTVLINPALGSWLYLGVILINLELEPDKPEMNHCGLCSLCLDACPTKALAEPFVMNLSKCISHLSQYKDDLTEEEQNSLGANLLGCDICQDVCPFNRKKNTGDHPEFQCQPAAWAPDLDRLEKITDDEYMASYAETYLGTLKPALLRRNARIVKGNLHANRL